MWKLNGCKKQFKTPMKTLKMDPSGTTQRHPQTGLGRDCSVALQASVRWRRPLRRRSSDLGEATSPTPPSSSSSSCLSSLSSSSSVISRCRHYRDRDCRSQCSSILLLAPPSRIRASQRHLAWRDGASRRDRIRPSASRGGRLSTTVINNDVDDDKDNIFFHNGIIDPLGCRDCAAAAAVVVVQVIVLVVDSISMAPRIRVRNSATVNSQAKHTIPVSPSSVTHGTDGIGGIDIRGYHKKKVITQ